VHAGAPPFYVGHGDQDQSVPFVQAVAFTNALKSGGRTCRVLSGNGGKHTYWSDPRSTQQTSTPSKHSSRCTSSEINQLLTQPRAPACFSNFQRRAVSLAVHCG